MQIILRTVPLKTFIIGMGKGTPGLLHPHHYVATLTPSHTSSSDGTDRLAKQRPFCLVFPTNWCSLTSGLMFRARFPPLSDSSDDRK